MAGFNYGGLAGYEDPCTFDLAERDFVANETILSGDIGTPDDDTDNSYHVVTGSRTNETAVLDGFAITAGNANGGGNSEILPVCLYECGQHITTNADTFARNPKSYEMYHEYFDAIDDSAVLAAHYLYCSVEKLKRHA